jgi:hypothetical protein
MSASDVMKSITPSDVATITLADGPALGSSARATSPSSVPGMLPEASSRVTRQSTWPLRACAAAPPIFASPALSRSVPYRRHRVDAEAQHQQRRHQRAATHTGEADDHADEEARYRVGNSIMEGPCT